MPLEDRLELKCYDDAERVVLCESMDLHKWHDDLHAAIDSDEFRRREGVIRVEGYQYEKGQLTSKFKNIYDIQGKLIEEIGHDANGIIIRHTKTIYDEKGHLREEDLIGE